MTVLQIFEEQIDLAIEKAQGAVTLDDIISILELKLMALKEQETAENEAGE